MARKTVANTPPSSEEMDKIFGKENPPTPVAANRRKMKAVTRPQMVSFDEIGTTAAGVLTAITEGETQFGTAEFLQMVTDEGEKISVCISSALALYDWESLMGAYVEIEYTGDEKSKKNKGKTFKTFDLRVAEDPEDDDIPF